MRRIIASIAPGALALGATLTAFGQPPAPRAIPPEAPKADAAVRPAQAGAAPAGQLPNIADQQIARRKMSELLARWEQKSAGIQTLDAQFSRTDHSAWGDDTFLGRAILKAPNLAFLDFQRFDKEKNQLVRYEQIRCTGKEVYHYRSATSQIFVYPLAPEDRQRALEEGPLPFLFNFRADEAQKRYDMTLVKETLTHYYIRIKPREEIDREAFISADIQLDKQAGDHQFLPDALLLVHPNGKDTQLYQFTGTRAYIKANQKINEENFKPLILKGWDVVQNPGPDGRPRATPAQGAPPAPVGSRPTAARPGQALPKR